MNRARLGSRLGRHLADRPRPATLSGCPLCPRTVENVGDRDLHIIAVELKQAVPNWAQD